jgi:cell division protein ZapA
MMDEHFIINLRIADTKYPLRIKRKDEEVFRRAAAEIDYKLSQYKSYFASDDSHTLQHSDYMAMTTIQAVTEKKEQEMRASFFELEVKKLIDELDGYLKK